MEATIYPSSAEIGPLVQPTLSGRKKVIIPTTLDVNGILPRMGKPGDGAHDLFASPMTREYNEAGQPILGTEQPIPEHQNIMVPAHGFKVIEVNIATEIPEGFRAWITGRSGLSRRGILAATGLIDSGYRGLYGVVLYNFSEQPFFVTTGDRIAQLSIEEYPIVEYVQVEELSPSERGTDGWGSTGLR